MANFLPKSNVFDFYVRSPDEARCELCKNQNEVLEDYILQNSDAAMASRKISADLPHIKGTKAQQVRK